MTILNEKLFLGTIESIEHKKKFIIKSFQKKIIKSLVRSDLIKNFFGKTFFCKMKNMRKNRLPLLLPI